MLEILKFIFSNFWIWLGTVILVSAIIPNIHIGNKIYQTKEEDKNNKGE